MELPSPVKPLWEEMFTTAPPDFANAGAAARVI
jgi:hypothetical protein